MNIIKYFDNDVRYEIITCRKYPSDLLSELNSYNYNHRYIRFALTLTEIAMSPCKLKKSQFRARKFNINLLLSGSKNGIWKITTKDNIDISPGEAIAFTHDSNFE